MSSKFKNMNSKRTLASKKKTKKERKIKAKKRRKRENKVKKYFKNNLVPGDFIKFPSGQKYKILHCGRAFPVCTSKNCEKTAQGLNKLYLFCKKCFDDLSSTEKEKFKDCKTKQRRQKQKVAAKKNAERSLRKALNETKLQKIDSTYTANSES